MKEMEMTVIELIDTLERDKCSTRTIKTMTHADIHAIDMESGNIADAVKNKIETLVNFEEKVVKGILFEQTKDVHFYLDVNAHNVFVQEGNWKLDNDNPSFKKLSEELSRVMNYGEMRKLHEHYTVAEENDCYTLSIALDGKEAKKARPLLTYLSEQFDTRSLSKYIYKAFINKETLVVERVDTLFRFSVNNHWLDIDATMQFQEKNQHPDFVSIPDDVLVASGLK